MAVHGLSKFLSASPEVIRLADALKRGPGKTVLCGATSSSKAVVIAAIASQTSKSTLVISNNVKEAERAFRELRQLLPEEGVALFPARDALPHEELPPSANVIGERLEVLSRLSGGEMLVVVSPIKALISQVMPPGILRSSTLTLKKNMEIEIDEIAKKLVSIGYDRVDIVGERGEFAVRGGIIDVFPSAGLYPARVDFLGDKIEAIKHFDVRSQRSVHQTGALKILPANEEPFWEGRPNLLEYMDRGAAVIIDDGIQARLSVRNLIDEAKGAGEPYLTFEDLERAMKPRPVLDISSLSYSESGKDIVMMDFTSAPSLIRNKPEFLAAMKSVGIKLVLSKQPHRVIEILADEGFSAAYVDDLAELPPSGIVAAEGEFREGFANEPLNLTVFTDMEIFGETFIKEAVRSKAPVGVDSALLVDLKPGDYVVHENYGIGIFRGLERLSIEGGEQEYVEVEYEGGDKLYVPLPQMGLISRYSSSGELTPKVNRLGGREWGRTKKKAMRSLEDLTNELLDIYAAREVKAGYSFPVDSEWQMELEGAFPYDETPDQRTAIADVKGDMESARPMDRLVCGDVGYGKTEVALRAAFKAAAAGKQAALLAPTTILVEQHYNNFKERFKPFPVTVEMLSRFRSKEEQREIVERVGVGQVDVIIGTHRLLQKDIKFKDLGLLIIDEEQKFGVAHKEKLKKLKMTVDVLSLTATPIPRTLYLSLSGARDLSMISTPPVDRSPIQTYVMEWSKQLIREAILRELERGGQIYYVYNYVHDIEKVGDLVRELVPAAKVAVAHGQMEEGRLEGTMASFMSRDFDILVCTTIIESGIDIPNVNTIIIDHASHFGLAQLYQLRGRVGRSSSRAYAYLLFRGDDLATGASIERLQAIREFTSLGSGYKLALRDLEIRGSGNLLGREQHGHMLALGFDLYCDMMERAIERAKGIVEVSPKEISIDIKVDAYIPSDYMSDERQRVAYYRKLALLSSLREIEDMKDEMSDRFGALPPPVQRLFGIIELKIAAKGAGIKKIDERDTTFYVEFFEPKKGSRSRSIGMGASSAPAKLKTLKEFIEGLGPS